jgi:hypothetical protein
MPVKIKNITGDYLDMVAYAVGGLMLYYSQHDFRKVRYGDIQANTGIRRDQSQCINTNVLDCSCKRNLRFKPEESSQ